MEFPSKVKTLPHDLCFQRSESRSSGEVEKRYLIVRGLCGRCQGFFRSDFEKLPKQPEPLTTLWGFGLRVMGLGLLVEGIKGPDSFITVGLLCILYAVSSNYTKVMGEQYS